MRGVAIAELEWNVWDLAEGFGRNAYINRSEGSIEIDKIASNEANPNKQDRRKTHLVITFIFL